MKYFFSGTGLQVLESLSFTDTLYAFDFDGTIAPIVSKPELACASRETERLLNELTDLVPVVIISGRSVVDLRGRLKFNGKYLIGNHGLEGFCGRKDAVGKAEVNCRTWIRQLDRARGLIKKTAGIFIEDKTYSLALHYRKSRNKKLARMQLFSLIEKLQPPPRVILGKCVMNLVSAGGPHKGVALLEAIMKLNLKCAFYIGDDDTDEDVFSLTDNRIITARVGYKKTSQAQFFLKRQSEMNRLLRSLIRINSKRGS